MTLCRGSLLGVRRPARPARRRFRFPRGFVHGLFAALACSAASGPTPAVAAHPGPGALAERASVASEPVLGPAVRPSVSMNARPSGPGHRQWLVSIVFSDSVSGFDDGDIVVSDGSLSNFSQINKARYAVTFAPPPDFDGAIRVSIPANVAYNQTNEGNRSQAIAFLADTRGPVLEAAYVVRDEITLTFDEDFGTSSIPDAGDFHVYVAGVARDVIRLLLGRDRITLILETPVRGGEAVELDYFPGRNPLGDHLGNGVKALSRQPVQNRTAGNTGAPSPPRSLYADAAGPSAIDLAWSAPADSGSARIDGYQIEWSEDSGLTWRVLLTRAGEDLTTYTHTGLRALTTHHYRIRATNSYGRSDPSNVASATTAGGVPGRPTGLVATAAGSTRINLTWRAALAGAGGAATGYRIEVSANGVSGWTNLVANTRSTATTYPHSGLAPGTTRHYRVSAINREGVGSPSAVANATTATTVPGAPTNLRATPAGQSQINLTWSAPAATGGSRLTGYRIEVSRNGGATWTLLAGHTGSLATSYFHTGLSAGVTRHYRVAAINARGAGMFSSPAHATTTATVPRQPTGLQAVSQGPAAIRLSWSPPLLDGGAAVTGYRIDVSTDGGRSWGVLVANTGSTIAAHVHSGLGAATTRHYRVAAINSVGTGAFSAVAHATTVALVPGAPRNLEATATGHARIDLEWDAPAQTGGAPITGYRIEVSANGVSGWTNLVANTRSTATTYPHSGLAPGTTRHYRVSAINREGVGSPSAVANATTATTVPGAPTNLRATPAGQSQINLTWSAPAATGGSRLTGYRIEVSRNGGATWTLLAGHTGSLATSYFHTGLSAGVTRHYRVAAINARGAGMFSSPAHATTTATVPRQPTGLQAVSQGPAAIRLSWSPPLLDGGAAVTGYRIDVSTDGGRSWGVLVANTGSTIAAHVHSGLGAATTRHYRVAAINSVGTGAFSAVAHATTVALVPGAPRNLEATATGHARIDLEWDAPAQTGGAPITGYRIEVSEDRRRTWRALVRNTGSNVTRYSHRGLSPRTTRHYRVVAMNRVGRGPASNVAFATTDADLPGAPTGLQAAADGPSRIDLAWTAPVYTGGVPIIGYRIEVSEDAGSSWRDLVARTRTNATEYTHSGLPAGTTRHYRVSTINQIGTGTASAVARATTESTVPGRPASLSATPDGTSRIDLAWTAPAEDGGARITGYRVEVSDDGEQNWTDLVPNTRSRNTTWAHRGLEPASTRHYRVSAINSVGVGDPSDVASATTDATVPAAPTNLVATAVEPTRIELAWTAPAHDGGAPITGYRIEVSEDGALWRNLVPHTGVTATIYSHSGLMPGSTRFYRVSATNSAGTGMPSQVASATTDDGRERTARVNESILSHAAAAVTSSTASAISSRIDALASSNGGSARIDMGGAFGLAGAMMHGSGLRAAGTGRTGIAGAAWLVDGTSFALPVGRQVASEQEGMLSTLAMWGGGDYVSLGEPGGTDLDWSGNLLNLHVGGDVRVRPDIVAGAVATTSGGSFEFTDRSGEREVAGTYDSRLTSINPYAAWLLGDPGTVAWASAGYGWGDIEIDDELAELRSTGTTMLSGAVGGSRTLLSSGTGDVRVRGEGWVSRVSVNESEEVASLTLDMQRLRLLLEWSQSYRSDAGDEIAFLVEGGMRYDGGAGAQGTGVEVGSGMRFVNAALGLRVEGRGRLLVTGVEGYGEWGVGGIFQVDPAIRGQGLSIRVAPSWGETASGAQELWERGVSGVRGDADPPGGSVDGEVAYGLAGFAGTPYGGFLLGDSGSRAFSSGLRYETGRGMGLRLEATRRERPFGPAEHTVGLRGRVIFQ